MGQLSPSRQLSRYGRSTPKADFRMIRLIRGVCATSRRRARELLGEEFRLPHAAPKLVSAGTRYAVDDAHVGRAIHRTTFELPFNYRSDLKPVRSSSERNFGCSQAAK